MKPVIAVPAIFLLCYRAYSKKSLTPLGIFTALLTAIAHAVHPWNLPFVLLVVFFLAGTRVTHVKKEIKASLTVSSGGASGGEGPRTHIQVLANSLVASVLSLLHAYQLHRRKDALIASLSGSETETAPGSLCFSWGGDLLVIGIIANYASVAADTFSSELGILSRAQPRLITSWNLRKVPPGTNGGVTPLGLFAGLVGSMIIVAAAMFFLPLCNDSTAGRLGGGLAGWTDDQRRILMAGLAVWGTLGSFLDSFLGGIFQRSVKDVRSGKIVEGEGGVRVLVSPGSEHDKVSASKPATDSPSKYDARQKNRRPSFGDERPSRIAESGFDLLDNNDVNFLMAFIMSFGAMGVASWYWGVPMSQIFAA